MDIGLFHNFKEIQAFENVHVSEDIDVHSLIYRTENNQRTRDLPYKYRKSVVLLSPVDVLKDET